jgi:transcription antitermination factor NusG
MEPGDMVRIIREPYFGVIGRVEGLPVQPQQIETETKVRVVKIKLPDGSVVVVPRANVEMIQL